MLADAALLGLFLKDKTTYVKYNPLLKAKGLSTETRVLLADLGTYYETYPDQESVEVDTFALFTLNTLHFSEFSDKQILIYRGFFDQVKLAQSTALSPNIIDLLRAVKKEYYRTEISNLLDDVNWDAIQTQALLEEYLASLSELETQTDKVDYSSNALADLQQLISRSTGLQWGLNSLRKSIGPLIPGDFGVIAAYVETGKTSFLASEVVNFAKQITEGDILWFNNEQPNDRVQERLWAAATLMPMLKVHENPPLATQKYLDVMHGDLDRIKMFDCDGWSLDDIKKVMEQYNPKLVIIDMVDKLRLPGTTKTTENWIVLQKLYHAARKLALMCPVLATSQCNATVLWQDWKTKEMVFQHYIELKQLAGSAVDKQAAMDFLITIGKDPAFPNTRYIHVAKNKLPGCGDKKFRYIKREACFNEDLSLYTDFE